MTPTDLRIGIELTIDGPRVVIELGEDAWLFDPPQAHALGHALQRAAASAMTTIHPPPENAQ